MKMVNYSRFQEKIPFKNEIKFSTYIHLNLNLYKSRAKWPSQKKKQYNIMFNYQEFSSSENFVSILESHWTRLGLPGVYRWTCLKTLLTYIHRFSVWETVWPSIIQPSGKKSPTDIQKMNCTETKTLQAIWASTTTTTVTLFSLFIPSLPFL